MQNKKIQVWLPLLFAIVMIIGMFFGYKLNDKGSSKGFFSKQKTGALAEAVELIRQKYVDSVNLDSLEGKAIREMINELDPHSVYFPPVELKAATEDLQGRFDGIGVEFNVFSDTVNIVYVIPNGPSDKAGLLVGDKILKVNGSPLTGKEFSNDAIKNAIRGESGSKVDLLVARTGKQLTISVKRGSIPVSPIDAAYMINKTTGYIKLNKFSENSYEEFMAALEGLQKEGMQDLVYDLRGNGGGFMNEAVDMADEFLESDKLIVYTEGVNSKKREYRCKRPGLFEKGKLTILIDEFSASASEVLAGALQDWDRATIIGRRSFGKGLVQEQYPLNDGSAIRLTIARYYTPLGRSIQRSYTKGKKVYMDDLGERFTHGELMYADSNKISNGTKYETPGKRVLYGGGGIMPDVFVSIDTNRYQKQVVRMFNDGSFNSYVYNYYLTNRNEIEQYKTAAEFVSKFNSVDQMWDGIVKFAAKDSINLAPTPLAEKNELKQRLKALLARYKWRTTGFYQVLNADDATLKKALEVLGSK